MIREIQISAAAADEDTYTEPPSTLLILAVIGGDAHVRLHACGEQGKASDRPLCAFQIPPPDRCCSPCRRPSMTSTTRGSDQSGEPAVRPPSPPATGEALR
jgi:hypothetical protein